MEKTKKVTKGISFSVDMLNGSPLKKILIFCLPLFAVNVLNMLISPLLTKIYERFVGEDAFYIPALVGNAVSYVGCIVGGVVSSTMIYVARAKGETNSRKVKRYLFNAVYAVIFVDTAICLLFFAAYQPIFRLLHVPREAYGKVFLYYGCYLASYIFTALGSIMVSVVGAYSNVAHIFILNVLNTCFPLIASFVLLGVFKIGLAGVAVYVAVNSVVVCAVGCVCLFKKRELRPCLADFRPDFSCIFRLIGYGFLLSLQSIFCNVGYLFTSIQTNTLLSKKYIAASGVVTFPISSPMTSASSAISVFCAQNIGAGNEERVRKGIRQTFVIMELYALFCMLFNIFVAEPYWNLMFEDAELIRLGVERWRVSSFGFLFLGVLYVLRFALDSLGYGKYTLVCGFCEFIVQIFCAFLLIPKTGNFGASVAQGLSWGLSALYLLGLYAVVLHKKRKKRNGDCATANSIRG